MVICVTKVQLILAEVRKPVSKSPSVYDPTIIDGSSTITNGDVKLGGVELPTLTKPEKFAVVLAEIHTKSSLKTSNSVDASATAMVTTKKKNRGNIVQIILPSYVLI
jgi:hypothetical protein